MTSLRLVLGALSVPVVLGSPAGAQSTQGQPAFDCGFHGAARMTADYLTGLRLGVIPQRVAPRVPPGVLRSGAPGVVTTDDIFPFEDSAGVLLGAYSTTQLIDLMVDAANALMAVHGDSFDFVGYWLDYDPSSKIGTAFYKPIENDVTGIGDPGAPVGLPPTFDLRPSLGLAGQSIEGFVMMWNVNASHWVPGASPGAGFTRLVLGQEFCHRYGLYLPPLTGGQVLQGDDGGCGRSAHWSWRVDGQGSSMEISEWIGASPASLVGSFVTFNTDIPGSVFSYTDLYLMGYATPAEMDAGNSELRLMETSDCSSTYFGAITDFTSADIIASAGPRVPPAAGEDQDYRTGWIMLHLPGATPTTAELQKAADILNQHTADWSTSTLGRGTMDNTLPPVAAIVPYGCGVNPAGSLTVLGGIPAIGTTVDLGLDNPLGSQGAGSLTFLGLSTAPDPSFPPCGTPVAGLGMGLGGVGELLIDVAAPNPFVALAGPSWTGPGSPASIPVAIPDNAALIGVSVFVQGMIADPAAAFGVVLGLTRAFELRIGP